MEFYRIEIVLLSNFIKNKYFFYKLFVKINYIYQ